MREDAGYRLISILLRFLARILILSILTIGCSDSTGPDRNASNDQFTSTEIGTDGGSLEVTTPDGTVCRLTIPAGTLSETMDIKITAESSPHESMFTALSNSFLLEPEGIEFDEPIMIEITVPNAISSDQAPVILLTSADGSEMLLETQVNGQTLSASLDHFSRATPVIMTADELVTFWNNLMLEIDTYGINEIRALTLCVTYLIAYYGRDTYYTSIDHEAWREELTIQTSTLTYMGSLQCAQGEHDIAETMFDVALFIADKIDNADLKAEAQHALDNCGQTGTILINQAPDDLSGAGWTLTGPRNQNGSGYKVLNDIPCGEYTLTWKDVEGYYTPESSTQTLNADESIAFSGVYIAEEEEPPLPAVRVRIARLDNKCQIFLNGQLVKESTSTWDAGRWAGVSGRIQRGQNTFKFVVTITSLYVYDIEAVFEVQVDDELFSYEIYEKAGETDEVRFPQYTVFERTETLTF